MNLFYELIQASLGVGKQLSLNPSTQEWCTLYKKSERQAILGITLQGIDVLPDEQRPPKDLLLNWIGVVEAIRQQKKLVNLRLCQLIKMLANENQRYCLLKGQGNAMMYPNSFSRTAGDIDVWLEGDKKQVVEFVHSRYPDINVQYHHMDFPIFDDVEVEVHYFPSFCYNKIHNKRLQKYFRESSEEQFRHIVKWNEIEGSLCVPRPAFNLVFQLSHMMRHFFTQGIGLRHAIDYYYLLNQELTESDKEEAIGVIKKCGMYKFLCAIMWIETVVCGLNKNVEIALANEKVGRMVLQEMMKGGNFGKSYPLYSGNVVVVYAKQMAYRLKYIKEFPSEPLWRPIALVWDFVKKRV